MPNDKEKAKPAPVTPAPVTPSAEDLDIVAEEDKAKEATTSNDSKQAELQAKNQATNSHQAADTTKIDSLGKPKEGGKPAPVGGRGVNAPRDSKPAPDKRTLGPKVTVTDKVDNAGNPKPGAGETHHIGIRGTHTVRDTFKL